MSSIPVANFASCLGKYDTTIQGSVVSDSANYAGTGDISFNGGYILNTTAFVLPAPVTGNGISFSGWFYPTGVETANTALFDVSCTPVATTSQIAVYFTGTNAMSMTYNGTSASTSSNVYSINAWNFFMYTVCCSGNVAIQNLYVNTIGTTVGVNPATLTNSVGTYTQYTVNSTFLGFGAGSTFGVTKYMGKMDDFRFYSRVITPMEYRVLQGSNYGNTAMIALTPSTGTITAIAGNTTSIPFLISNSGTYSFLQYKRIKNNDNSTVVSGNVSTAIMSVSGGYYLWTDTNVSIGTSYLYTWTPYVLGNSGQSTSLTVATFSIASPFTNFIVSNILAGNTGFTLNWTGGTGTSVTYSCYINNVLVSPATGSLSNGTTGVTFTGLTAPTSGTTPTPYAWYIDICANNIGTVHGITTIYCPPTPIVLSSSYNAGYISLALVSGGLCNSNSALTWSYIFTSGVGVTSSQTNLSTFPVSPIGVIGTGSWTITVSANNICSGTTVGSVSSSVSSFAIPFSGLIISNILTGNTGFTLNWTGGTGTSVTYGCYINNVLVSPATGSLSNGTTGVTFTGLTAPTSGTTPTPYAWYIDICANITGTTGTIHGINTFYCPPTPFTITSAYSSNVVTLTLASGGLCNASSSLTWAYQFTSGTSGTMSQTGLGSFPTSLGVTGSGPWSIIVTATNISAGTIIGYVSSSVAAALPVAAAAPTAITGMSYSAQTQYGFTVSWSGGAGATSYAYSVTYTATGATTPFTGWTASNYTSSPVVFTNMTNPTAGTYNITVTATNSTGSVFNTLTGCLVKPRYIFAFSNSSPSSYGGVSSMGYSADGVNWTGIDNGTGLGAAGIIPVGVATNGSYGSGTIMVALTNISFFRATNGTSYSDWTYLTSLYSLTGSNNYGIQGIAYGNGKWIVCGTWANYVYYSSNNGSTWTQCTIQSGVSVGPTSIAFGNGYWMLGTNQNNTGPLYSTDGVNFNLYPGNYNTYNFTAVIYTTGSTFLLRTTVANQQYMYLLITNYQSQGFTASGFTAGYIYSSGPTTYYNIMDMTFDPVSNIVFFYNDLPVYATALISDIIGYIGNTSGTSNLLPNYANSLTMVYLPTVVNSQSGITSRFNGFAWTSTGAYKSTCCATSILPGLYIKVGGCRSTQALSYCNYFGGSPVMYGFINNENSNLALYNNNNFMPALNAYNVFPTGGNNGPRVDWVVVY